MSRAAGEVNSSCRSASTIATPSELDSTRLRKSSSLRTRSSVSRLSSRMRRPSRTAISDEQHRDADVGRVAVRAVVSRLYPIASGTPSMASTTSAMPQGLTRGAAARALRSAFDVGA